MKIKTKLFICNVILALIIVVVCITGILYVYYSAKGESVTISGNTLTDVKLVFSKAETSTKSIDVVVSEAQEALYTKGFDCFYYSAEGDLISTDSDSSYERKLADKHYNDSFETSMIIEENSVIFVSGIGSGHLVAVNTTGSGHSSNTYMIIFLVAVSLAAVFMVLAATLAEKIIIFPRLEALKEAMHMVYQGNYEQIVKVETKKTSDELSQILAEFEMMRQKMLETEKEQDAIERERGSMLSGISHDLRTPLAVIQGYAKGLKDGVARRINREGEYIDKIYDTTISMNALLLQLSAFAKRQSKQVIYTFVEHDICDIIKEYVSANYLQYVTRGLEITTAVPTSGRIIVNMDKIQFMRVLQNICENSLKYKVKSTAKLNISVIDEGNEVAILLADDGPGIKDFEADYIFESYYRGDESRTNPVSGSGLGLSVVKSIVTEHKGTVKAYNDNGLTIKINIPIRRRR